MSAPQLVKILDTEASQAGIIEWLKKYKGISAPNSRDKIIERINAHLQAGKLTQEDLRTCYLDLEEHGGKHVYLLQLPSTAPLRDRNVFARHINGYGIPLLSPDTRQRIRRPATRRLNYAFWSPDEIRIKFSETHERVQLVNFESVADKYTRFIVISANPETGFVKLMIDPAGNKHAHEGISGKPSERAYEEFYLQKARELLGEGETFDISLKADWLLKRKPPVLTTGTMRGTDADGYPVTIGETRSGRRTRDTREARTYQDIKDDPKDFIKVEWLAEASGDKLHRNLRMTIHPKESKLLFRQDCLGAEIDYVISSFREIQNPKSATR